MTSHATTLTVQSLQNGAHQNLSKCTFSYSLCFLFFIFIFWWRNEIELYVMLQFPSRKQGNRLYPERARKHHHTEKFVSSNYPNLLVIPHFELWRFFLWDICHDIVQNFRVLEINQLSGIIPPELGNLTSIERLWEILNLVSFLFEPLCNDLEYWLW